MTIVVEAWRVATVAAHERGDTCATATEVTATLRRWSYITTVEQTRRDCCDLRLTIADSHIEPPPSRARPVVL